MPTFVLQLPWGTRLDPKYKVKYDKTLKAHLYTGSHLPAPLVPYASEDFSLARWYEDEFNAAIKPHTPGAAKFSPYEHQKQAAAKILAAYKRGNRSFLEADSTGTGKALAASTLIATPTGFKPLGSLKVLDEVLSPGLTGDGASVATIVGKYRSKEKQHYQIVFNDCFLTKPNTLKADISHRFLAVEKEHLARHTVAGGGMISYSDLDSGGTGIARDLPRLDEQAAQVVRRVLLETWVGGEVLLSRLIPSVMAHPEYRHRITKAHSEGAVWALEETKARLKYITRENGLSALEDVLETWERVRWLLEDTGQVKVDPGRVLTTKDILELTPTGPLFITLSTRLSRTGLEGIHIEPSLEYNPNRVYDCEANAGQICSLMRWRITSGAEQGQPIVETLGEDSLQMYLMLLRTRGGSIDTSLLSRSVSYSDLVARYGVQTIDSASLIEDDEEYYCISVDSPTRSYFASSSYGIIPTHNTLSTLAGVSAIQAHRRKETGATGRANLLIVCPKSVIPQWRQTIRNYPVSTALLRPLILNYQQLSKLLRTEKKTQAKTKKGQRRANNRALMAHGEPIANFDYIIFDESQYLKNYTSDTSKYAAQIAALNKAYKQGTSPFVVFSTATPGSSPLNLTIMAGLVAPLLDAKRGESITPLTWGSFLQKQGFAVSKGKSEWTWASVPWFGKNSEDEKKRREYERLEAQAKARQRKDARRIGKALSSPDAPFIHRSPVDISGWPTQQLIPMPVSLEPPQIPIYEEAWSRFRSFLRLSPSSKDPKTALVENLRYRQKASLLKVDMMVDQIADWVQSGYQVYVSCEFMDTIDRYRLLLEKKRINCVEISGRNTEEREEQRLAFQKGQAQVVLCTVVAGISLHAEETLPDGTRATKAPRITVVHNIRQNPLDTSQAIGRAHREGQNSLTYFPYLENTVEQKLVDSHVNKNANMSTMIGRADRGKLMEQIFLKAAQER